MPCWNSLRDLIEIHFEQAQVLAGGVVELGDEGPVLEALHHGDNVGEFLRGHNDRAGVDAPLAGHALQSLGEFNDLLGVGVLGVELAELLSLSEGHLRG